MKIVEFDRDWLFMEGDKLDIELWYSLFDSEFSWIPKKEYRDFRKEEGCLFPYLGFVRRLKLSFLNFELTLWWRIPKLKPSQEDFDWAEEKLKEIKDE